MPEAKGPARAGLSEAARHAIRTIAGGERSQENDGMADKVVEIETLTTDERLDLLERLWDSLSGTPGAVPLTEAQRHELDRRDAELDEDIRQGRPLGIPWDEILRQIRARS